MAVGRSHGAVSTAGTVARAEPCWSAQAESVARRAAAGIWRASSGRSGKGARRTG